MSKVVLLGDTHAGVRGDSIIFRDFQNLFFEDIFFPYCIENNIKEVWQFGDFFDKRKTINFMTLQNTRENILEKFIENDIQLHILLGNHDQFYRNDRSINSLRELLLKDYQSHVTIYDYMTTALVGGNMKTDIIPWLNPNNMEEFNEYVEKSNSPYAFGHLELNGYEMMKGHTIKKGMDVSIVEKYDKVFSGHYHTRSEKGNVRYLGTPYEMTWSDYADDKGFYLLDTDNKDLTFIRNPHTIHNKIIYNNNYNKIIDHIEDYRNKFVKVNVIGKSDSEKYELFLTKLYNVNPLDISITENYIDVEDANVDNIDVEDSLTILLRNVESISDSGIDNDKLGTLIREIHTEALSKE